MQITKKKKSLFLLISCSIKEMHIVSLLCFLENLIGPLNELFLSNLTSLFGREPHLQPWLLSWVLITVRFLVHTLHIQLHPTLSKFLFPDQSARRGLGLTSHGEGRALSVYACFVTKFCVLAFILAIPTFVLIFPYHAFYIQNGRKHFVFSLYLPTATLSWYRKPDNTVPGLC